MKAEQNVPRRHETFVKKPGSLLHSGPRAEIMAAARSGAPNLQPENDTTSATDICGVAAATHKWVAEDRAETAA